MGKAFIVALLALSSTLTACSLDCTAEDGTTVDNGDTYNDGCNDCVCENGGLVCDLKRCG